MVHLIEVFFAVMLDPVMTNLWRFDMVHSVLLGVLILCNYFCALLGAVYFNLSVAF